MFTWYWRRRCAILGENEKVFFYDCYCHKSLLSESHQVSSIHCDVLNCQDIHCHLVKNIHLDGFYELISSSYHGIEVYVTVLYQHVCCKMVIKILPDGHYFL